MNFSKQLSQFIFSLVVSVFLSPSLIGQAISFEDISAFYPNLSGSIVGNNGETSGYYFTTAKEVERSRRVKGKKKTITEIVKDFEMVLFDQELNRIGSKVFRHQEGLRIKSVAYNGTYLAVELSNHVAERKWIELIDANAETVRKVMLRYSHFDRPSGTGTNSSTLRMQSVDPLTNGFLVVSHNKGDKGYLSRTRYGVQFIPNEKETKGWTLRSDPKSKDYEGAYFLGATDSLTIVATWSRPNLLSLKATNTIKGIHTRTGKEVFEYIREADIEVAWLNSKIIDDKVLLAGYNVGESNKVWTDTPEGINLLMLDQKGMILQENEISIQESLADTFTFNHVGLVKGKGNLFLHDIGINHKGEVAVACEFYRTFNGELIAKNGMVIYFDDQQQMQEVQIIEKGRSSDGRGHGLMGGINLANNRVLAARAKLSGGFDFVSLDQQGGVVRTLFFAGDSQMRKEKIGSVHVVTLVDGQLGTEQIDFAQESKFARIFSAKKGYIMIMEYGGNGETAKVHLERSRF